MPILTGNFRKESEFTSEMKTDLNLLLECLKFQMDNPESQKAALVTIYSICQENDAVCEYFREIGGLMFVSNLAKCSKHSIVKEASLFTLGVLAESNVYCQQTLCTLELFEDVCASLSNEDSSVNLKRMSVYVFLVLVSNNKCGQNLARQSGCIDMLLLLFREILPKDNMCLTSNVPDEYYQLWCSICSALCACANNPQNDENQKLCSSAFPQAKDWLLQYTNPEIVRPICSLVGLTVASNSFAQGYFSSVGGLDTLADVFSQLVTNLQFRESDPKVAVAITKTLDACITDNPICVNSLSKHSIVSSLIKMLSHETLDKEDRFSIVLTLGHCTENCEENQYELLKNNGLPLMIQVLTESQDEELNKAATFVLQNCRQITERFSASINSLNANEDSSPNLMTAETCLDEYWIKAKAMLHKIESLQRHHNQDIRSCHELDRNENNHCGFQSQMDLGMIKHSSPTKGFKRIDECLVPSCPDGELVKENHNITLYSYSKEDDGPKYLANASNVNKGVEDKVRKQIVSDAVTQNESAESALKCSGKIDIDNHVSSWENGTAFPCRYEGFKPETCFSKPPLWNKVALNSTHPVKKKCKIFPSSSRKPLEEIKQNNSTAVLDAHILTGDSRLNTVTHSASIGKERNKVSIDPLILCSDIIDEEICSILGTKLAETDSRCSGCLMAGINITSRNCVKILGDCLSLCDNHRVILQAEDRYKKTLMKSLYGKWTTVTHYKRVTPLRKGGMSYEQFCLGKRSIKWGTLTPISKGHRLTTVTETLNQEHELPERSDTLQEVEAVGQDELHMNLRPEIPGPSHSGTFENPWPTDGGMVPQKSPYTKISWDVNKTTSSKERCDITAPINKQHAEKLGQPKAQKKPKRRTRKDFTVGEISCLVDGVKKLGHRWNSILWFYPFQQGRSGVDLAKKYRKLQVQ